MHRGGGDVSSRRLLLPGDGARGRPGPRGRSSRRGDLAAPREALQSAGLPAPELPEEVGARERSLVVGEAPPRPRGSEATTVAARAAQPRRLATHAVARSPPPSSRRPRPTPSRTRSVWAAEHGDQVTSDQFKAGLAEVRTEIAEVRTDRRRTHRGCEPRDPAHPLDGRHGARDRWADLRDPCVSSDRRPTASHLATRPRQPRHRPSPRGPRAWRAGYPGSPNPTTTELRRAPRRRRPCVLSGALPYRLPADRHDDRSCADGAEAPWQTRRPPPIRGYRARSEVPPAGRAARPSPFFDTISWPPPAVGFGQGG